MSDQSERLEVQKISIEAMKDLEKTSLGPKAGLRNGRILLADDDADFRAALADTLDAAGYTVQEAADGKLAQTLLTTAKFDVIVSDIKMPQVSGIELLHHVKKSGTIPFVMMTGFANVLETQDAYKLGVSQFLTKPFSREEVLKALDTVFGTAAAPADVINLDPEYCRLPIDEFHSGSKSLADIYLRLSAQNYAKVAKKGVGLSLARIESYKAKGLRFLHIHIDDWGRYVGFNLDLARSASGKEPATKAEKLALHKVSSELLERVILREADKACVEEVRSIVLSTVMTCAEDRDLYEYLAGMRSHTENLCSHSLGVSFYSCLLAKEAGWKSGAALFKIAMAGLLHDVGLLAIDPPVLKKPLRELTKEERERYESHPTLGGKKLANIRTLPDDVFQAVLHHHENHASTGYPSRMSRSRIHPMARFIFVAEEFCELALGAVEPRPILQPAEAIRQLYEMKPSELDPIAMKTLMEVFKYPVPDELNRAAGNRAR